MRIGCYQFTPAYGEVEGNRARLVQLLGAGPPDGRPLDLVVLPELCTTGYTFGSRDEAVRLSEPADGPTSASLS